MLHPLNVLTIITAAEASIPLHGRLRNQVAESRPQRTQPWLEVAPMVEAFLEDRPAHLLGTRRSHPALGFVKLETRGLEIETAEIEDAPHIALEIVDHILVLNFEDLARQHRIPV